ncbi:DcuS/MalK family sensor histidine kinase [Clostridium formicaceticum]|uniref:histidine kinase n=1 Tax=Clostridium formicaceticum TaxID=1497 RepID=A0AAC9WGY6_9CLOT|nr:DcuS/MalK family sensor histidine kinase [Clostridium formicaceticum]AOY77772.1 hypothetical protein BJL90_19050 [Clostridium formicaceticum]ARE88378.1 Sensor histidine kinase DcuS [Clostridium formicaceticum]
MKNKQLKLQTQITLFTIIIVIISIYTTIYFATRWTILNMHQEISTNIMNIAKVIGNSPNVVEGMKRDDYYQNPIQPFVQKILAETNQVEIIVVADMEGFRYAHPNPERLGEKFVGGDELRVVETGESYISEATGTMGTSIRAFAPIYDEENHQQLGFVMVGTLIQTVAEIKKQRLITTILASFVGLFFGIIGAILLANSIKKNLLGLEPDEIAKLYVEKKGMLEAIHEGVVAIDSDEKITLINDSARKLFHIDEKDVIGIKVTNLLPTSRLPEVLRTGVAEYDREQLVKDTIIISNRVPIKNGEEILGAIATFRDKTMITRLAEEVTGVKQIVAALRANSHEFMNKLHVILGLIEIEEFEEAKNYIIRANKRQQQIMTLVMGKIKDATIAGLLLGKISRAKELGITMTITEDSYLEKRKGKITSSMLVTILGNLIENAMEAISLSEKEEKAIKIDIIESHQKVLIKVKDTGRGISEEDLSRIFKRGFSTKKLSSGIGLSLVKNTVDSLGGSIKVTTNIHEGTEFTVTLPKEGENHDKGANC